MNENVYTSDLQAVFAEQVSAAFHNIILNQLLQVNNRQLKKAYTNLEKGYMDTIEALRLLVDAKDIYTRGHSDRVAYYAVMLAKTMGKSESCVERVRAAGMLHDIGKIGISDAILKKSSKLTDVEYNSVKKHPRIGANILSRMTMFHSIGDIVCAHHERYDGAGYPNRLCGDEIPEEARMIAIADAFDAMMSDRHYRKKLTLDACIQELKDGKGTQFDGRMVDVFLGLLEDFYKMERELRWTYEQQEETL